MWEIDLEPIFNFNCNRPELPKCNLAFAGQASLSVSFSPVKGYMMFAHPLRCVRASVLAFFLTVTLMVRYIDLTIFINV